MEHETCTPETDVATCYLSVQVSPAQVPTRVSPWILWLATSGLL